MAALKQLTVVSDNMDTSCFLLFHHLWHFIWGYRALNIDTLLFYITSNELPPNLEMTTVRLGYKYCQIMD